MNFPLFPTFELFQSCANTDRLARWALFAALNPMSPGVYFLFPLANFLNLPKKKKNHHRLSIRHIPNPRVPTSANLHSPDLLKSIQKLRNPAIHLDRIRIHGKMPTLYNLGQFHPFPF